MKKIIFSILTALLIVYSSRAFAKIVHYKLTVTKQSINLSGKKDVDFALTVNGGIPAPTLEFTEGDDAEIKVINQIPNEEVSIHWHGILLPPMMDGVPYVSTPPIRPGESFVFKYKIRQHGTYWYHSHTSAQEQKGVYGAIVIRPKKSTIQYDKDVVAVLSDWSDENADQILKNLRKDGDYYLNKKDTMRSWTGAIESGALKSYLGNQWARMNGMDLSDVGYDAFLINGKRSSQLLTASPGEIVRLRIINASASSYFHVSLGQDPIRVISADGIDIKPIDAKELLMGIAETYDVLFTVPDKKNYELRATAQDGTGYASTWIGAGEKVLAPDKSKPDLYAAMSDMSMDMGSDMGSDHSAHKQTNIAVPKIIPSLTVDDLKALSPTTLPVNKKIHNVKLVLGGDMERYIWHINGKAINEDYLIEINEGEIIRFTYENTSMMHHPMHLHGHFFRVLNKNNEFSPLKHTVDVPPHSTRIIEFYANEPGEWMLHCHNLYHLKTGMARVVKYSSFAPTPEIARYQKQDPHLHDPWYFYGRVDVASNQTQGFLRWSQTWNQLDVRVETRNASDKNFSIDEKWETEGDLFYRRWMSNYFSLIAGATNFDKQDSAVVGTGYILPMLIRTTLLIDQHGKLRFDIEKKFQWSKNVFSDLDITWRPNKQRGSEFESEYKLNLMYARNWSWAAGLTLTDKNLGAGLQIQF